MEKLYALMQVLQIKNLLQKNYMHLKYKILCKKKSITGKKIEKLKKNLLVILKKKRY